MRFNPNGRRSKVSQAARELLATLTVTKKGRLLVHVEKSYKQYQELPLAPAEHAAAQRLQEALDEEDG